LRVDGVMWFTTGETPAIEAPKPGSTLAAGQRVATAPGQGVALTFGHDTIELAEKTTIEIGGEAAGRKKLALISGALKVEASEDLVIETSRLELASKGAAFIVRTSDATTSVTVKRGLIVVTEIGSGTETEVAGGQRASIEPDGKLVLSGRKDSSQPQLPQPPAYKPETNDPSGPYAHAGLADARAVTAMIAANTVTPTWVVVEITRTSDSPKNNLPIMGTIVEAGMEIATYKEQTIELTNGRDQVHIRGDSTVKVGNDKDGQSNFEVVRGGVDFMVGDRARPFSVSARHLVTAFGDAKVTVSTGRDFSALYVEEGSADLTASATGNNVIVQPGYYQIVRPPSVLLKKIHPGSDHPVFEMH
jgi:ferric-dicitrate binding protein FerR (iron transport regulator)